ncbi:MAG: hypothetical protein GF341_11675 [candidate division Zixibacteria bacterium]|nr:hypothetical protein [candidate division Zixibacteria bacterium]
MMVTRVATIACALAILTGCNDNQPVTHEPVQYNIYAAGSNYLQNETVSHLYWYDADSLTLIDSLLLPNIAIWGEASPDGRYLYLVMWPYRTPGGQNYIAKWDVATKTELWRHQAEGYTDRSPFELIDRGRLLLYGREVIDANTGETVRRWEDSVYHRWEWNHGPENGHKIAAICRDTVSHHGWDTLVSAMDMRNGARYGGFVARFDADLPPLILKRARLHPDGRRVLCVGAHGSDQNAWFVVGDLVTGEQLLRGQISTTFVEIGTSQHGEVAVVADRANKFFLYGLPSVHVYDLTEYVKLTTFVPVNGLETTPGQVRFLPGDHRFAVFPDPGPTGTGWVQVFDLNTLSNEAILPQPFPNVIGGAFAVGPRPTQP